MNNVKKLSTIELEDARDELEIKITTIKGQVELAKAEAKAAGEYSDIYWFNKAKQALRISGQQHQFVIRELAARRKKSKGDNDNSVENHFINIARTKLDDVVFQDILQEAVDAHEQ